MFEHQFQVQIASQSHRGTFITRNRAFANFTFTVLLLLDQDLGVPPQSLIDCIAHGTVPIIVGKHHKVESKSICEAPKLKHLPMCQNDRAKLFIIIFSHSQVDYTRYFSYAIAKFRDFSVEQAITFMLTAPADALYVYANSVKIVQEFFYMRPSSGNNGNFCFDLMGRGWHQ